MDQSVNKTQMVTNEKQALKDVAAKFQSSLINSGNLHKF